MVEAGAATIDLHVDLGTPVMETGQKQKTFLKVGVKGYKFPEESDRAPVNLAIVLDRSGSMHGEKLAKAKEAAIMAIDLLNSKDIVSSPTSYDRQIHKLVDVAPFSSIRVTAHASKLNGVRHVGPP